MNLLDSAFQDYVNYVDSFSEGSITFILRLSLLLVLQQILTAYSFYKGSRGIATQFLLVIVGLFLAFLFPLSPVYHDIGPLFKTFLITISLLAIVSVPATLPFFLVPYHGLQQNIRKLFYGFIIIVSLIAIVN